MAREWLRQMGLADSQVGASGATHRPVRLYTPARRANPEKRRRILHPLDRADAVRKGGSQE
jgi:hypothetical protein